MDKIDFYYHHDEHFKKQLKSKKTIWISLILTLIFAFLELFGGIFSNSLSLVSDSFHMFSDVAALIISMVAIYYSEKNSTKRFTFGYLRFEILASFLNGLALCVISLGILYESILRFIHPVNVDFKTMGTIAVIGLIINIVLTVILTMSLRSEDNMNVKSALLHFTGDILNSIGVIVAALLINFTGNIVYDIIISFIISIVIFIGGVKILKESGYILMETVPEWLDIEDIRESILNLDDNIEDLHEFHLWSITEDKFSLSFHVLLKKYSGINDYVIVKNISDMLKEKYEIEHVNIQIENLEINEH